MPVNSFADYPMSWKPTLHRTQKPLYLALAAQLEADIRAGILLPGTKLPPQRELADFLDINVSTVSRAFKRCANQGLLSSAIGSGTFVSYDVNTSMFLLPEPADAACIELGTLMPETLPQADAIALLQKMLTEPEVGLLFQYSYQDIPRHQAAALRLFQRVRFSAAEPAQILFAMGGQNAIAAIFCGLFRPGDRIGVDPVVYSGMKGAAKLFGIQLIPIRQENGEMSAEGLLAACKNDGIRGIYVMPDLQNPTNHTMTLACRKAIARIAQEQNLLILEDGIQSLLAPHTMPPIAALAPAHTIYILSLSKAILPMLRLAYLHAPAHCYDALQNALHQLNLSHSPLLLELASRLILSGKLDDIFAARRAGVRARNALFARIFAGYPALGDENCLSRWLLLPDGLTGKAFEALAKEKGVSVYGSERFAVGKNVPVAAARLAICAPPSMEELEQGLCILRDILEEWQANHR